MIKLKAVAVVEGNDKIDGFHLMWNPLLNGHFPSKGYSLWRRKSNPKNDKPVCRLIDGTQLQSLHNNNFLLFPPDSNALTTMLYRPGDSVLDTLLGSLNTLLPAASLAATPTISVYEARFSRPVFNVHVLVAIKPPVKFIMAVGFRDGRVVGSKKLNNTLEFFFTDALDRVVFYVPYRAESIKVCYEDPDYGKPEDWEPVVKDLTLPFTGFAPGVSTVSAELNLFNSRIRDGVLTTPADFGNISKQVTPVLRQIDRFLLPATSLMQFAKPAGDGTDSNTQMSAAPLAILQTFCQDFHLRAGLGFSYQDQKNLVSGASYDYKITALFRRHCFETVYDFHTVPLSTQVGPLFALGGIFFYVTEKTVVSAMPGDDPDGNFVKGISVDAQVLIVFPQVVTHFSLYCFPSLGTTITIAGTANTFPVTGRTEIKLATAADRVLLKGNFFVTGVALPVFPTGSDPNEDIEIADYSFDNVYKNTPRLSPPVYLNVTSLQQSWVANQKQAPVGLGFLLTWQQPPSEQDAIDAAMWPPDLQSPPPLNLAHYRLEYRKLNSATPADWFPYDDEQQEQMEPGKGVILPANDYSSPPSPMSFGADLLIIYPDGARAGTMYSNYQKHKHVLNTLNGKIAFQPGTYYQYRIWTVDLMGRESLTVTESNPQRLEKRQPPPSPAGLSDDNIFPHPDPGYRLPDARFRAGGPNNLLPRHVYTRVIQPGTPGLTQEERTLLGTRDKITILTWTWGPDERKLDPFVSEFRIYFRVKEFGLIEGQYVNGAVSNSTNWNLPVQLSAAAIDSEFVNSSILLNKVPFRILSQPAGTNITLQIESPRTSDDKTPRPGSFQLFRKGRGEETRPVTWDKRIAVVPLSNNQVYQYVLETGTLLNNTGTVYGDTDITYVITPAGSPIRAWLGVSASDAESYVDDQLISASDYSPRHGNESGIATAPVNARYYGRPVFNPPPPLDDVDVLMLDEAKSDQLVFSAIPLELLTFLSGNERLIIERVSGTDLMSLLQVDATSIQLSDAVNPVLVVDWVLNPADEAELRNAFLNSNRPIPAKFIYNISKRNDLHLEQIWKQVNTEPVAANQPFRDLVPNKMERYVYRARIVNEINMPSENAAFFPYMWRSPDKTIPPSVKIDTANIIGQTDVGVSIGMVVKMPASLAFGVKGLLIFAGNFPAVSNPGDEDLQRAQLLKIPNRPDLLIEQTTRLRVLDLLIEPTFVPIGESIRETTNGFINVIWNQVQLDFGFDQYACIWALSVSEDNILSPIGRCQKIFTGPTPPAMPDLTISRNGNRVMINFSLPAENVYLYRIESSAAGPADGYKIIKDWFKAQAGVNELSFLPTANATTLWIRTVIKYLGKNYTGDPNQFNL